MTNTFFTRNTSLLVLGNIVLSEPLFSCLATTRAIFPYFYQSLKIRNNQLHSVFKQDHVFPRLKSSSQNVYGRHHEMVDRHEISTSQMDLIMIPLVFLLALFRNINLTFRYVYQLYYFYSDYSLLIPIRELEILKDSNGSYIKV